jgi:hypothetical protein
MSADGEAAPAEDGGDGAGNVQRRTVAIGADTAELLAARAAALGISVAELIAALAGSAFATPRQTLTEGTQSGGQAEQKAEQPSARWSEVKAWIDSWGRPDERPRPKLGK